MKVLTGWSFTTTHYFPFLYIIMRWSLILSAFIAVQSTLSFVCVALPISTQSESDELERREPAGSKLKLSSDKYRANARDHPLAYHVTGLQGKLTNGVTVKQEKLRGKQAKNDHADKVLATHGKGTKAIHAGMLLSRCQAAVLNRPLCSNRRSCP
jgi:hypothetical protein